MGELNFADACLCLKEELLWIVLSLGTTAVQSLAHPMFISFQLLKVLAFDLENLWSLLLCRFYHLQHYEHRATEEHSRNVF